MGIVDADKVIQKLQAVYPTHAFVEVNGTDPYRILISCILSLRTQDTVSLPATVRLFKNAPDVDAMVKLRSAQIAKLIYPVGFYRTKAQQILNISKQLIEDYAGQVPNHEAALLKFKGVGRKTANLVLSLGFNVPAICVDTHVHRISNRLGWVKSKTPAETEIQLNQTLAKKYWIPINSLFVNHGQRTCRPLRPCCSECPVTQYCEYYMARRQNSSQVEAK